MRQIDAISYVCIRVLSDIVLRAFLTASSVRRGEMESLSRAKSAKCQNVFRYSQAFLNLKVALRFSWLCSRYKISVYWLLLSKLVHRAFFKATDLSCHRQQLSNEHLARSFAQTDAH